MLFLLMISKYWSMPSGLETRKREKKMGKQNPAPHLQGADSCVREIKTKQPETKSVIVSPPLWPWLPISHGLGMF